MANNPSGFHPVRNLDGTKNFRMTLRPTLGKNDTHIFPGDIVRFDASGGVQQAPQDATGADTALVLGVVGQCFNSDLRPLTFNQPTEGPFIRTSTEGWVGVYENPHTVFRAQASATANLETHVGKFMSYGSVDNPAPLTAAGISRRGVRLGTTVTADGHFLKFYNPPDRDWETV